MNSLSPIFSARSSYIDNWEKGWIAWSVVRLIVNDWRSVLENHVLSFRELLQEAVNGIRPVERISKACASKSISC